MAERYHVKLDHNVGIIQGVHHGDNNFTNYNINGTNAQTPRQYAEQAHDKVVADWKNIGTCEWLLERPEFKTWTKMENQYSFLWIYGIREFSEVSRVIECIRKQRTSRTTKDPEAIHLLYFYIGYGDDKQKQQFYRTMLMTFWEQTVMKDGARSSDVFSLSSDEEIQEQVNCLLASAKRDVYIVVDGLDQLPLEGRRKLLNGLNGLVQKHKDAKNEFRLAVAISSRDCTGYDKLREHKLLQIQVQSSDNSRDIRKYLEKKLDSDLFDDRAGLKNRVLSELVEKAKEMFLWAKLQAANICEIDLEEDVLYALKTLVPPEKMADVYKQYSDGFESSRMWPKEQQIALRTMAILAQTGGSMSKEILLVALALNIKDGKPDPKTYKDLSQEPAKVVRICKHLIDINESLGIIRFCHMSVFEFFSGNQPAVDHSRIAQLCLAHLSSSDFSDGPHNDAHWYNYGPLRPVLQKHPFLEFASCNWATSMNKSVEPTTNKSIEKTHEVILGFLKKLVGKPGATEVKKNLQLSFQVYLFALGRPMPAGVCHEHIFSYFALLEFFDVFRDKGWLDAKTRDHEGSTAIHWAIRHETEQDHRNKETALVVERLIRYGGDMDAQNNEHCTPLYDASRYGNLHVVRLLLRRGAQLNIQCKEGETALIGACREHHQEIVSTLVEAGADVQIQSAMGTALQALSLLGCDSCAKLLLDRYGSAPIVETRGPFSTSLHVAAFHGHSKVVKLLCAKNVNVRATNETYGSVLTAAAIGCYLGMEGAPYYDIFQELIRHGVDVNDSSGLCGPALRAASFSGYTDLVRLLLQAGAKVQLAGPMGTAYKAADERSHEEIKRLLLERDPNAAAYEKDNRANISLLRDRVQREVFKFTFKASNMAIFDRLNEQYEGFCRREIERGKTPFLCDMASLGKYLFNDAISLATATTSRTRAKVPKEHDIVGGEEEAQGSHPHDSTLRKYRKLILEIISSIDCTGLAEKMLVEKMRRAHEDEAPVPESGPSVSRPPATPRSTSGKRRMFMHASRKKSNLKPIFMRRQSTILGRDTLEGRFPELLERMTRAAVNVLEHALLRGDPQVINLIADTWVDALNNLLTSGDLGQPLLERVLQSRTVELRRYLADTDLELDARFENAHNLARVGVELLLTAVRRGPAYSHLSLILAKLWVSAVDSVEDLGQEGQESMSRFLHIFAERFSGAVKLKDRINAEIVGHAGIEFLRWSALSSKRSLLNKCSEEWARQWKLAIEGNMGDVTDKLVNRRWAEYQKCVVNKQYDEALGLAVAGIEVLREAIKQRFGIVVETLIHTIDGGFSWTLEQETTEDTQLPEGERVGLDVGRVLSALFDAGVNLFATAETSDPNRLHALSLTVLDSIEAAPSEHRQALTSLVHQRIQVARKGVHAPELELQLMQISTTIVYLLNVTLHVGHESRPHTLSVLRDLALALPGVTERSGFGRYEEAINFLKLQGRQGYGEEAK
ncbi:hypothetical protein F4677DRAFT_459120 [Hypoxylon crocopeplum]|nr:hypothetical protein F4677DRAFT_459120 [Hypoxylon crocopeplum]